MRTNVWVLLVLSFYSLHWLTSTYAQPLSEASQQKLYNKSILVVGPSTLKDDQEKLAAVAHAIEQKRQEWGLFNQVIVHPVFGPASRKKPLLDFIDSVSPIDYFQAKYSMKDCSCLSAADPWHQHHGFLVQNKKEVIELLKNQQIALIVHVGSEDPHAIDFTSQFLIPTLVLTPYVVQTEPSVSRTLELPWTRLTILDPQHSILLDPHLSHPPSKWMTEFATHFDHLDLDDPTATRHDTLLSFVSAERSRQEIFLTGILFDKLQKTKHPKKFIFVAPTDFAEQDISDDRNDYRSAFCAQLTSSISKTHTRAKITLIQHTLHTQWGRKYICSPQPTINTSDTAQDIEILILTGHFTQKQTWDLLAHSQKTILVSGDQEILASLMTQKETIYQDPTGHPFSSTFAQELRSAIHPTLFTAEERTSIIQNLQDGLKKIQATQDANLSKNSEQDTDESEISDNEEETPPPIPLFLYFDGGLSEDEETDKKALTLLFSESEWPQKQRTDFFNQADFLQNMLDGEIEKLLNYTPLILDLRRKDITDLVNYPDREYILLDQTTTQRDTNIEKLMRAFIHISSPWVTPGVLEYFKTPLEKMRCVSLIPGQFNASNFLSLCHRTTRHE